MADISITNAPVAINYAKLDADLRAAFPTFTGLSTGPSGLRLHFSADPSPADVTQAESIVATHDADVLTPEQQAALAQAATLASAVVRVRDIPEWARIADADAEAWIQTHMIAPIADGKAFLETATTLAHMKTLLAGMLDMMEKQNDVILKVTLMTLAQRDALWPGLVNEDE